MRTKQARVMSDDPTSAGENVVNLRTRRRPQPASGNKDASPADLEDFTRSNEPDDFRHRMRMNAIAFGFVALLVVAALWLANSLATMRKDQDCVLSGKRGCTPVEASR